MNIKETRDFYWLIVLIQQRLQIFTCNISEKWTWYEKWKGLVKYGEISPTDSLWETEEGGWNTGDLATLAGRWVNEL